MRNIVFIVLVVLLFAPVEAANMNKDDRHEGGHDYPDNRTAGYEFLGWGMYGPGALGYGGYGMGPGMWGYDANRYDKFQNDTVEMRRELHNRQFDYNEALRNRDIKYNDLIKMEIEILELQMKIKEKWWNRID